MFVTPINAATVFTLLKPPTSERECGESEADSTVIMLTRVVVESVNTRGRLAEAYRDQLLQRRGSPLDLPAAPRGRRVFAQLRERSARACKRRSRRGLAERGARCATLCATARSGTKKAPSPVQWRRGLSLELPRKCDPPWLVGLRPTGTAVTSRYRGGASITRCDAPEPARRGPRYNPSGMVKGPPSGRPFHHLSG